MSQRVVGYEGDGRHRRPVFADEGPAAPGATDGLASLGRLSALTSQDLDDGAGRGIERRQITEAEIEARAVVRAATAPQADPPVRRETAMPTVQRKVEPGDPPAVPPDPAGTESRDISLAALLDATKAAVAAWQEVVASEYLLHQAYLQWDQARAALDAAYRTLDWPPAPLVGPDVEPASTATSTSSTTTTGLSPTSSSRPTSTSSTTATARRSRQERSGRLSANQERVLASTIRHGGVIKAVATELGFKHYQSVTSCLQDIGKKGLLPADLIPKLPAAFARFGVPS